MEDQLIFRNPVTGIEKPVNQLTMLDDFKPEYIAKMMAGMHSDNGTGISFAKRSIIACFIENNPLSLFIELPMVVLFYSNNRREVLDNEIEYISEFIHNCTLSIFPDLTMEDLYDFYVDIYKEINMLTNNNHFVEKFFSWMDEGDDETLWLKFYQRLMGDGTTDKSIKLKLNF